MNEQQPPEARDTAALAIPVSKLRRRIDHTQFDFATTAEVEPARGIVGQERALAAIRFGADIDQPSFNLFVLGPPGAGKTTAVRGYLEEKAASETPPDEWVYVNNFHTPDKPKALSLPRGRAGKLSDSMVDMVDELRSAIPAMFESDDYQNRRRAIDEEMRGSQEEAFSALSKKAEGHNIALLRTPLGFAIGPTEGGKVIKPEQFKELSEEEQKEVQEKVETLQSELQAIVEQVPRQEKKRRNLIRKLNEEFATLAVGEAMADVREAFGDLPDVLSHLDDVERDLVTNVALFLADISEASDIVAQPMDTARDARFRRYMVNVVIGDGEEGTAGAPVLEEVNPTLGNLVGRVEHLAQMGALVTDFLLIKPGALHKANGGYLILDARKVLLQPFAWEALKRALKAGEVKIESPAEGFGLATTVSLDPDPIPLDVKTVLVGDRTLYYLLSAADPEFAGLFKVAADFDDTMDYGEENAQLYARLVASIAGRHGLKPVTASGVARLVEEALRLSGDNEKLTLHLEDLADILSEADYYAGTNGRDSIDAEMIEHAVSQRINRQDRLREKAQEQITRDIMLVDTEGSHVGQVNGLSVLTLGGFAFGRPSRITARVRMGTGRLIDIEREVELGGPIHSKGVMILRGFLEGRYAHEVPLSLSASLVFEQSYGGVEGDSASTAELYALLSAIAEVPLRQSVAVTGSVNQYGQVQAIGGANEKIEGYYDICRARGLTGDQAVIIPASNVVHLMLREDVLEAVERGEFAVFAVSTIDQGMEILTGVAAGERGPDGRFPTGTINRLVEDRLIAFAEARRQFGSRSEKGGADS